MELKIIQDKERNFNKEDEGDFLDYSNYVSNLEDIIKNTPDTSFTIGLFGGWGSGKSSIINTVKDNLKDEKIKFITYDAWKYSDDPFRRTFLFTILKDLKKDLECQPSTDDKFRPIDDEFLNTHFYNDIQKEVSTTFKINRYIIILPVALVCIALLVCIAFSEHQITPSDIISIISLSVSIIALSIYPLKTQINEHFMFAPEQFESCFNKLIDSISSENNKTSKTLPNCFNKLKNSIFRKKHDKNSNRYDKIVFVIDNLDRCSGSEVIEKLKTIKTFLSDRNNIIFLIPLDDYSLKKYLFRSDETNKIGLENKTDHDKNLFVNEFLRKIFDVYLRIKNMNNINIKEYGDQIQSEYNLEISKDTWLLISDTFVNNPRRIIQFFNNLQVELNNYEQNFRDKYEMHICKILIISEEYPNIYRYLSNHFQKTMDFNQIEKDEKELNCSDVEWEEFMIFNKKTLYISGIRELKAFNRIFHNSGGFNNLPKDINDAINSNDYDQISKVFTGENKEILLNSLYFSIDDYYGKRLYDIVTTRVKLLLYLYKDKSNEIKFPVNIESILKNMIDKIINDIDDFKTLLLYSQNHDGDYNRYALIYSVADTFNKKFQENDKNINISYLREIFRAFPKNEDVLESVSESVHYIFKRYHNDEDEILNFFNDLPSFKLEKTYYTDLAEYLMNHSFIIGFKCLNCFLDCLESQAKMHILDCVIENLNNKMYNKINLPCLVPLLKSLKEDPSFDTKFNHLKQTLMRWNYNYYHEHNISNWLDKEVYK